MFVIAHHFIQDPEAFWNTSQEAMNTIPPHIKLHAIYPSLDAKTGTCVWEAPNAGEVQNLLDNLLGKISQNVCYEVNEKMAMGLPQKSVAEAMA